jgi:hypothetical protein
MPDGSKVEVFFQPKQVNEVSEFVQILSKDRRNLPPKEQADIRASIVKKQHPLYDHMDLTSTNIDEPLDFKTIYLVLRKTSAASTYYKSSK